MTAIASFFVRAYACGRASLFCTGFGVFRLDPESFQPTAQSMREHTLHEHCAGLGLARRKRRCGFAAGLARRHPRVLATGAGHPRAAGLAGERLDGN